MSTNSPEEQAVEIGEDSEQPEDDVTLTTDDEAQRDDLTVRPTNS